LTAITMESFSAELGLISRVAWPVISKVNWVPNLERMSQPRGEWGSQACTGTHDESYGPQFYRDALVRRVI
jgi:hypothetical protein